MSHDLTSPQVIDGVIAIPMSVFVDGFGRNRHAQIGACSADELVQGLEDAHRLGWKHFVYLSHNFEMLKVNSLEVDWFVQARFEHLCAYLSRNRDTYRTTTPAGLSCAFTGVCPPLPQTSRAATLRRHAEQLARRVA